MDLGRQLTNQKLSELEKKVKKEYEQAEKELRQKLDEHFRAFGEKDAIKRRQLKEGIISASEYKQWRVGQMAIGERWEAMRKTIAEDLVNKSEIAKSISDGYMADVYALNMNFSTYEIEKALSLDTSFVLYNHEAVEKILRENPELLPPPGKQMLDKIAKGKAVRWEEGKIQSAMIQAILQGEKVTDFAKRIAEILAIQSLKAAMRYARTAITGAENAGRLDSYYRAESMGIKLKKTWLATLDGRTRHSHANLDGQTVPVDQPFVSEFGEIDYPGDPGADPADVWNCRCSMVSQIEGFERDTSNLKLRNVSKFGGMSYNEWKNQHGRSEDILNPFEIEKIMKMRYAKDYKR